MGKRILGIILMIFPIIFLVLVLVAYAVASFIGSGVSSNITAVATSTGQTADLASTISSAVNIAFGVLGIVAVLGIIIGFPVGLWLFIKARGQSAKFSFQEAISFGWHRMTENFWLFFSVMLINFLVYLVPVIWEQVFNIENNNNLSIVTIYWVLLIISSLIQVALGIGLIALALKLVDGQKAGFKDLKTGFNAKIFINYIASSILYGLISLVGFILLVIPGIIWGVKYSLYQYFIITGEGPINALKKSGQATAGAKADLWVFSILLGLINLAGFLCLIVGLLATAPTILVAQVFVFRKLESRLKSLI